MKTIAYTETLVYYDGTQVFEGRDSIGMCYIGVLIDSLDSGDRYVVTEVSPDRMKKFRAGALDLRTLLVEEARRAWYITQTDDDFAQPCCSKRKTARLWTPTFLPEEGFVLRELSPSLP